MTGDQSLATTGGSTFLLHQANRIPNFWKFGETTTFITGNFGNACLCCMACTSSSETGTQLDRRNTKRTLTSWIAFWFKKSKRMLNLDLLNQKASMERRNEPRARKNKGSKHRVYSDGTDFDITSPSAKRWAKI